MDFREPVDTFMRETLRTEKADGKRDILAIPLAHLQLDTRGLLQPHAVDLAGHSNDGKRFDVLAHRFLQCQRVRGISIAGCGAVEHVLTVHRQLVAANLPRFRIDIAQYGATKAAGFQTVDQHGGRHAAVLTPFDQCRVCCAGVDAVAVKPISIVFRRRPEPRAGPLVIVDRAQDGTDFGAQDAEDTGLGTRIDRYFVSVVEHVRWTDRQAGRAADALSRIDDFIHEEIDRAETAAIDLRAPRVGPFARVDIVLQIRPITGENRLGLRIDIA